MSTRVTLYSLNELRSFILKADPALYVSSQTSTVLPYTKPESFQKLAIVDLNQIPGSMKMQGNLIKAEGAVSWKDLSDFAKSNNRQVKTYPTEEAANVLAGIATSCTGERCFGHGTLRDQIVELTYMNHEGKEITLKRDEKLFDHEFFKDKKQLLEQYQNFYKEYASFKNAPFPRLENQTDLLTGTEGQLGIVTSCLIETTINDTLKYLFVTVPKWEEDYTPHLEIFEKVQNLRNKIHSCELLDSNSIAYLDPDERPVSDKDVIVFEIFEKDFEDVYESLLSQLTKVTDEDIFEIPGHRFHQIRMGIPRAVFERNTAMGVVKKGTDVQVNGKDFSKLLDKYREFSITGIGYNLFGHFGDAHLHFNFMPTKDQIELAQENLESLYNDVLTWKGSPFAEHGIGLLKQDFIRPFLSQVHFEMFKFLKSKMDPKNQFFPLGYMNL